MKKTLVLLAVLLIIQLPVAAEIKDVSYTFDEKYEQTLNTGLKYEGYFGKLDFTVNESDIDEAGMILSVERLYHLPFKIPFVGNLSNGNFSMRIGGRGLVYGDYTVTPYYVKKGTTTYGEPVRFNISESCVAMTNLRIAYTQINILTDKGIFDDQEQEIVDYITSVAARVIADGENGVAITKEYVSSNYRDECSTVKGMYDVLGDDPKTTEREGSKVRMAFAKKFNEPNIDKVARVYLMTEFELMRFM